MSKVRTILILAVACGLALFAATRTGDDTPGDAAAGGPLFPGLVDRLNDIAQIEARSGEGHLTLRRDGQLWSVVERFGYRADRTEIRALLVGASELRRIEPKTAKAELFAKLELDDPAPGRESVGYTLKDGEGKPVAEIILGKRQLLTTTNDADQYYVRIPSEGRAWLVEGKIPKHRFATDWLDTTVLRLTPERVHRATIKQGEAPAVRAVKAQPGLANFTLLGVPAGKEVENDFHIHSLATSLTDVSFAEVAKGDTVDFTDPVLEVEIETFDGLRVRVVGANKDKDIYVRYRAEHDAQIPTLLGITPGPQGEDKAPELAAPDAVAAEAQSLNERWNGWIFRIPTYHLDNTRKTVADLVRKNNTPKG